jgi:hypothetical protein
MDATDNNSINCYLRAEDFIIDQPEAQWTDYSNAAYKTG